ncbi:MAG TPA: hypothetical protein VK427_27875 [Kofleriaceae bacterium]|nr:hypothetical protein [Kofleriaceae bacterium]
MLEDNVDGARQQNQQLVTRRVALAVVFPRLQLQEAEHAPVLEVFAATERFPEVLVDVDGRGTAVV